MKKHVFTDAEKWAVYTVHKGRCKISGEPVRYREFEVDHILPENLLDDPKKLADVRKMYGLTDDFEINSFENWIPIKSKENKLKSNKIYEGSMVVQNILYDNTKLALKMKKVHDKFLTEVKEDELTSTFTRALEIGIDVQKLLDEVIESRNKNNTIEEISFFELSMGFGTHPLQNGWELLREMPGFIDVKRGNRVGATIKPDEENPDLSWLCPNCLSWGPWNGARCENCGHYSCD